MNDLYRDGSWVSAWHIGRALYALARRFCWCDGCRERAPDLVRPRIPGAEDVHVAHGGGRLRASFVDL